MARLHGPVELDDAMAVCTGLETVKSQAQASHQGLAGDFFGNILAMRRGRGLIAVVAWGKDVAF